MVNKANDSLVDYQSSNSNFCFSSFQNQTVKRINIIKILNILSLNIQFVIWLLNVRKSSNEKLNKVTPCQTQAIDFIFVSLLLLAKKSISLFRFDTPDCFPILLHVHIVHLNRLFYDCLNLKKKNI